MRGRKTAPDLLPGALELLILRVLVAGRLHGYGIAQRLKLFSDDVLEVGESSLYPALQRLLLNGWVTAGWGASENNRRARYYALNPAGRRHLASERAEFNRSILPQAIDAVSPGVLISLARFTVLSVRVHSSSRHEKLRQRWSSWAVD